MARVRSFGKWAVLISRRLAGRMERVGQKQQRLDKFGLVGSQHARLPAAVGLTGEKNPAADDVAQRPDRRAKPCAIPCGVSGSRRSRWPLLTEREIAAQVPSPPLPERPRPRPEAGATGCRLPRRG